MSNIIFYRCEECGNIVTLLTNGKGTLVCCEKPMIKLEPNTTDGATEKHVPVILKENGVIKVTIGSTLYPMLSEHYIEWIVLDNGKKTEIIHLKPNMEPRAEFADVKTGTIYEYCNVHGLWKADF